MIFLTACLFLFFKFTHAGRVNPAKNLKYGVIKTVMMDYSLIKRAIRDGIKDGIDFAELRYRIPDVKKRQLISLIFDVMHEMGTDHIPFTGMISRPRLTRKPIPIDEEGTMNILPLLQEKGFDGKRCEARCHIGNDKITLTVKPVKTAARGNKNQDLDQDNFEFDSSIELF